MPISKRLTASAKYLKGFKFLADCGTDHAYLPIYALEQGLVEKAIASDNKFGPIVNAKSNIMKSGLVQQIDAKFADGLPYLNESIDVVSIIGMGGRLITSILEKADKQFVKRFVLGPNSEVSVVRQYLMDNHFNIVEEEIIEEKGKYYQIIVSEPGKMVLNELELEFGPINLKNRTSELRGYILKLLENLKIALPNINNKAEKNKVAERIKKLEEVIS